MLSGNQRAGVDVHVAWAGHTRIDFDKRAIKRALRKAGGDVRRTARRLVASKVISTPGDFPGKDTGVLLRSIMVKVSRAGFWVRVAPQKTAQMAAFYPAFLFYGTSRGVARRGNYMTAALGAQQQNVRAQIRAALQNALISR